MFKMKKKRVKLWVSNSRKIKVFLTLYLVYEYFKKKKINFFNHIYVLCNIGEKI